MELNLNTKINAMLEAYPKLLDFLVVYNPKFSMLKNPAMRMTMGNFATVQMAAGIGGVEAEKFLQDLRAAIEKEYGKVPETQAEPAGPGRAAKLKGIIQALHAGADPQQLKQEFREVLGDVAPGEISRVEEQLIKEGLPVEEVQRLCDLHVEMYKSSLANAKPVETPPGHPVHTYMQENLELQERANAFSRLLQQLGQPYRSDALKKLKPELEKALGSLMQVHTHYLRKENQLFPFLERHDVTAPPKVMWGVDDQIRASIKAVQAAIVKMDPVELENKAPCALRDISEMIYKENKILFPMCLEILSEAEWVEIKRGEDELGYLVQPGKDWNPVSAPRATGPADAGIDLKTGKLTVKQVVHMLTNLPLDISYVDANDEVRFYSEGKERIFPRTPGVIGRKVQNCHPAKSVDVVNRILNDFKAGKKDMAEFWINMHGKMVHIRYFAIRDDGGTYMGTLEVTQDITSIRALQGERRLLDWK